MKDYTKITIKTTTGKKPELHVEPISAFKAWEYGVRFAKAGTVREISAWAPDRHTIVRTVIAVGIEKAREIIRKTQNDVPTEEDISRTFKTIREAQVLDK